VEAAEVLRTARREAQLTQAELARRAGVSQQVVSRIETGRTEPTLPTLRRLVAAAGGRVTYDLEPPPDPHDVGLMLAHLHRTPEQRLRDLRTLHRFAVVGRRAVAAARA